MRTVGELIKHKRVRIDMRNTEVTTQRLGDSRFAGGLRAIQNYNSHSAYPYSSR